MPSAEETTSPPADATGAPPLVRTQTDASLRSCFICLQTPAETPNTTWVNACPCSLEAHEDCMLHWIAEHERESSKTLRCPACKGKIQTIEPSDRFVSLRGLLHKAYSRIAPAVLLGIFSSCSVAGSGYYGLMTMTVFAGPRPAVEWIGLSKLLADRRMSPNTPWCRWVFAWHLCFRFWTLSLIAPALLVRLALNLQFIDILTLPFSLVHGALLVLRDEMPTWPPSPAWALTMAPWVSFSYNRIYQDIFGGYERRLNKALRGRGIPDGQPPAVAGDHGVHQADVAPENPVPAPAEEDDEGYLGQALRVGNAVLNLNVAVDEEPIEADIENVHGFEIQIQIGRNQDGAPPLLDEPIEEAAVMDANGRDDLPVDMPGEQAGEQPPEHIGSEGTQDAARAAPALAVEEEVIAEENFPPEANNVNQVQEDPERERIEGASAALTDLINDAVNALTFPLVCWGAGEVLRHVLPSHWVMRPHARITTGLLQDRWGRSLIGGMFYVVMRDAVNLYTKHRRVEMRKHRKVKNVPRRKPKKMRRQQSGGN